MCHRRESRHCNRKTLRRPHTQVLARRQVLVCAYCKCWMCKFSLIASPRMRHDLASSLERTAKKTWHAQGLARVQVLVCAYGKCWMCKFSLIASPRMGTHTYANMPYGTSSQPAIKSSRGSSASTPLLVEFNLKKTILFLPMHDKINDRTSPTVSFWKNPQASKKQVLLVGKFSPLPSASSARLSTRSWNVLGRALPWKHAKKSYVLAKQ